jgi:hypothetical protein
MTLKEEEIRYRKKKDLAYEKRKYKRKGENQERP